MSLSALDLFALFCVVFIGLPHGAFDGAVFAHLPRRTSLSARYRLASFLLIYVLIAAFIIGLWVLFPLPSLIGFLAISAFHFGKGDTTTITGYWRIVAIIAHGGLVTIYLPLMHPEAAFGFFALLTFQDISHLSSLRLAYDILGALWALILIAYVIAALIQPALRLKIVELFIAMIIMAYAPLLPAFAFYFCAIHSSRHFATLYHSLKARADKALWRLTIILSCASWLAGAIALLLMMRTQSFELAAIQIIFIGLSALTVPHMILIDGIWRPLGKALPGQNKDYHDTK